MSDPLELSIFERLAEPFLPEQVHWRVGSTNKEKTKGMALAYVDARDVMDRLDIVCGPNGWQDEYSSVNGATCCRLGIALHDPDLDRNATWVWKSDGAGETAYEGAKGQFSDAFKRAAVKHGVGRYLYDCGSPWAAIEPQGNSFRIKKDELENLNKELAKAGSRHSWGDRNAVEIYRLLKESLRTFCDTPERLDEFITSNEGHVRSLRVGAKRELEAEITRLKETLSEKAKAA